MVGNATPALDCYFEAGQLYSRTGKRCYLLTTVSLVMKMIKLE